MAQRTIIVALDLGTSATTASHVFVRESFDTDGRVHREKCGSVTDIRDWPGGNKGDATGNVCVPTDLVFDRSTSELLFWGFQAQQYLDDPSPEIGLERVFVVEHIKLLLPNPRDAQRPTVASERYLKMRENLVAILGKSSYEVFEDYLTPVLGHVIGSANRKYFSGIHGSKIELSLAFPSGWDDSIHTAVAEIGSRAVQKAVASNALQNMVFGIENVYTLSETLCGVKEWLRDTIAEEVVSNDLDEQVTNLDELNEGDCFLPVDIGGGTGCFTPLKLVTKVPLRVDQLGPTQSLEVSGEAVQAEFNHWLRPRITKTDYPGDISRLIYQICRRFKEEKKECGLPPRPGLSTWNIPVPRLRANPRKGFEKNCMRIDRKVFEQCFDPVLDTLEFKIVDILGKLPAIKAVVFLGQFGGSSEYLRKRMIASPISKLVKLRHSQSGKLNVVKGAISERMDLTESFVRKSETVKSYGALVSMLYYEDSEAAIMFPNPVQLGAVPFEKAEDGIRLKVIEWAIPKGTVLEDGCTHDMGIDGRRHHTWRFKEEDISFEDIIVVSDEVPPAPQLDGKSFTLWTESHEHNQLTIDNERVQIQQIPFSWDLGMSQKVDRLGNLVGHYDVEELEVCMIPEKKKVGRRREKRRLLDYDLVWDITEMQVKVSVRAVFPNQSGLPTIQLAKERPLGVHERALVGESRSKALKRDIEISAAATSGDVVQAADGFDDDESVDDIFRPCERQVLDEMLGQDQRQATLESHRTPALSRPLSEIGSRNRNDTMPDATQNQPRPSGTFRPDGRRRDGCYTCKKRKKKCDCAYTFDETKGSLSCNECIRQEMDCITTQKRLSKDPSRSKSRQLRPKKQTRLGKRKVREQSDSSGTAGRDRSTTANASELMTGLEFAPIVL